MSEGGHSSQGTYQVAESKIYFHRIACCRFYCINNVFTVLGVFAFFVHIWLQTSRFSAYNFLCRTLLKVGDLFEFPIKYIGFEVNNNINIDYRAIFQRQKEEFVEKSTRQVELARFVSSFCWGEDGNSNWQFPIRPPETGTIAEGKAAEKIICSSCGRDFFTEEMLMSKSVIG